MQHEKRLAGRRLYGAAVRMLPRVHRERFGIAQVQLYEDLVASGVPPWRLWIALPRDLVVAAWSARHLRPEQRTAAALGMAGTPGAAARWPAWACRLTVCLHLVASACILGGFATELLALTGTDGRASYVVSSRAFHGVLFVGGFLGWPATALAYPLIRGRDRRAMAHVSTAMLLGLGLVTILLRRKIF